MLTDSRRSGPPRTLHAANSPRRREYPGYFRRLSRQGTMTVLLLGMVVWGCARGSFFDGDDEAARRRADRTVANLDVSPGLEAKLFASEPMMVSPTNLDVDHRERVWVIDVVNYRGRAENNERSARRRHGGLRQERHRPATGVDGVGNADGLARADDAR